MISPCKIIDNFFSNKQIVAFCLILFGFFTFHTHSQGIRDDYKAYIEQYRATAVQHQQVFGIPASITLAQGLLESRAGKSGLALNGNNHFGIKDFHWKGEVVCYGDSSNLTCYRKYGAAEDSFLDHARFLKSKRYGKLYELDVTDYKAWAQGLRECGYAEDPAYPQKLINIIEQYRLHELDATIAGTETSAAVSPGTEAQPDESKAQKRAREKADKEAQRAAKEAQKRAQKAERERLKHVQEQERLQHEKEKKALYEQQRQAREQERLAQREQREQQRRERAERYAQRHSGDALSEKTPTRTAAARTPNRAYRSNAGTGTNASADND